MKRYCEYLYFCSFKFYLLEVPILVLQTVEPPILEVALCFGMMRESECVYKSTLNNNADITLEYGLVDVVIGK